MEETRVDREWLEADGLGGFASGTISGIRTRRYHALLLAAARPPADRFVLVNGIEAWIENGGPAVSLSSHRYGGEVVHPDGASRIVCFEREPWPRWTYRLDERRKIVQEIFAVDGASAVVLSWRLEGWGQDPEHPLRLHVRPLLSGRDPHQLQRENPSFRFEAIEDGPDRIVRPYDGVPAIRFSGNGTYRHAPDWYRNFLYTEERARGLDHAEDLASPGRFSWDLARGEAFLVLAADGPHLPPTLDPVALREIERARREAFPSPLLRAADAYLVRRGEGRTIVAGYPWFGDWGRDTFLAMRGLAVATGRLDDSGAILLEWAGAVSEGMLPNRFPDRGDEPEFNSVDAALWYLVAAEEHLAARRKAATGSREDRARLRREEPALREAERKILEGYARGARYGIRADEDGLLACGEPGVQLTWMDARVGDRVITPRIGKPVEIQALWLGALHAARDRDARWGALYEKGRAAFEARFWNEERGSLHDVVDVDHVPGTADPTIRPNQILAVGGLPRALLAGERARRVVETVERTLLTPLGLRSLGPGEPGYAPRYEGGVAERDGVYHQGTVWPWLLGPFVEAWVRVRGGGAAARREARERFLAPVLAHLGEAGLGHVSEIADADPPHTPRGCPFQAWSVGEILRLDRAILGVPKRAPRGAAVEVGAGARA